MMTRARFEQLERALRDRGYGPMIDWSESIASPTDAEDFAARGIYVICNSGMRVSIAAPIAQKCVAALREGRVAADVFGHAPKAAAIDAIWQQREALFQE